MIIYHEQTISFRCNRSRICNSINRKFSSRPANALRSNRQSISQHNHQHQSSTVVTAGANSPVTNSGNNAATATNTNNGGNAAAF